MTQSIKAMLIGAAILSVPAAAVAQTTITTTTTRTERGPLVLTPQQRTTVYKHVVRERVVTPHGEVVEYRVGSRLPQQVELRTFDEDLYTQAPDLRRYRYVHVNGEVLLVDPATSEVVEIITD